MLAIERPTVLFKEDDEASFEKTLRSIYETGFLNVWEGAVRSGKTVYALISFCNYVKHSDERIFLLSGRTLPTIEKNCILGDYGILSLIPRAEYHKVGSSPAITFRARGVEKIIYVSGASDIKSYMALRGNTYGGWFADEINMHDQRFVAEAFNRTVKSSDRKHFHTLNPEGPNHWYYEEYLDRYDAMTDEEKERLGGYHWWHYTPADNPALTPQMLSALELQYPRDSFLYARYVQGKRVQAEGLVYPMITDSMFRPYPDMIGTEIRYCAIDFGASHATAMMFGGWFNGNKQDWRIVAEYFDKDSGKTPYDYYVGFLDVCKRINADPQKITIAIDPSAKILRLEFIKHGLNVIKAKNDVLNGIEFTRQALCNGTLLICEDCKNLRREFASYSWNDKAKGKDEVIKENDDAVDALRYFAYTFIKPITGA